MKYGPISAAINAMIKAIANPSSVVCTVSPFERVRQPGVIRPPAGHHPSCDDDLYSAPVALGNQPRSSAVSCSAVYYRSNCGEVTAAAPADLLPNLQRA